MRLSTRTRPCSVPSFPLSACGSALAMALDHIPGSYNTRERHPLFESEFERNLFALRQDKLRQISELGQQTYPNQFVTSHTLAEVRQNFEQVAPEVLDAERPTGPRPGRMMAIRGQGKAGFAQLEQGRARLQIYVPLDAVGEQGFHL